MPQYHHDTDALQFAVHFDPASWTGTLLLDESGYQESAQTHSHRTCEFS